MHCLVVLCACIVAAGCANMRAGVEAPAATFSPTGGYGGFTFGGGSAERESSEGTHGAEISTSSLFGDATDQGFVYRQETTIAYTYLPAYWTGWGVRVGPTFGGRYTRGGRTIRPSLGATLTVPHYFEIDNDISAAFGLVARYAHTFGQDPADGLSLGLVFELIAEVDGGGDGCMLLIFCH